MSESMFSACLRLFAPLYSRYLWGFYAVYLLLSTGLEVPLVLSACLVNCRLWFNPLLSQIDADEFLVVNRRNRLAARHAVECTPAAEEESQQDGGARADQHQ